MYPRLFFALFFAFAAWSAPFSLSASVCEGVVEQLTAEKATSLLREAQRQYSATENFRSEFTQSSFLESLSVSETSSGTVFYERPGRMRWEYSDPEKQVFVFRDRTYWFFQPVDNQVIVDSASELFLTDLPISFLLGVGDLSENFEATGGCLLGEEFILELREKPGQKEKNLERFALHLSQKTKFPSGADVVDIGGNKTSIRLSDIQRGVEFKDEPFSVAFPAGVDIQDRRKASS